MAFWTLRDFTPKLKDRFVVIIGGRFVIAAKSVSKPTLTFDNKEYKMINHHFKYPGLPKWNTVKVTFVDMAGQVDRAGTPAAAEPAEPPTNTTNSDTAQYLMKLTTDGGYSNPDDTKSVSKQDMVKALGEVMIQQIDNTATGPEGNRKIKVVEQWKLINPIIKSITWGDLGYGEDGLVEYSLELDYDYAEHSKGHNLFGTPDVESKEDNK